MRPRDSLGVHLWVRVSAERAFSTSTCQRPNHRGISPPVDFEKVEVYSTGDKHAILMVTLSANQEQNFGLCEPSKLLDRIMMDVTFAILLTDIAGLTNKLRLRDIRGYHAQG